MANERKDPKWNTPYFEYFGHHMSEIALTLIKGNLCILSQDLESVAHAVYVFLKVAAQFGVLFCYY